MTTTHCSRRTPWPRRIGSGTAQPEAARQTPGRTPGTPRRAHHHLDASTAHEELAAAVRLGGLVRAQDPDALPYGLQTGFDVVDAAVAGEPVALDFAGDGERRDYFVELFFNLSGVWWLTYQRADAEADVALLDRAMAAIQTARRLTPPDSPRRVTASVLFSEHLSTRGARTGNRPDLDTAVARLRATLESAPADHEILDRARYVLVRALKAVADLDDTPAAGIAFAEAARSALAAVDPDGDIFTYITAVSSIFVDQRLAVPLAQDRDLDERAACARLAVAAWPAAAPQHLYALLSLGITLHARASARGSLSDNAEALAVVRASAVHGVHDADPARRAVPYDLLSLVLQTTMHADR
ncbi:hypothetical protein [Frankia sp. ACN1ag]|uniref:hypothetical protein n=1 Tax=Frankia sp. ACN1ag TaxID=102891 RepID=UPI0006DC4A96|nr:hypothetical protein [Frankia sp. ACN1ag]